MNIQMLLLVINKMYEFASRTKVVSLPEPHIMFIIIFRKKILRSLTPYVTLTTSEFLELRFMGVIYIIQACISVNERD